MAELPLSEVIGKLRSVTTTRQLWRVVTSFYHDRGVRRISCHRYRGISPQEDLPSTGVRVAAIGFPDDWVCHYIEQKLYQVDPIPELARIAKSPFYWDNVENMMRLSQDQREYMAEMVEAGVGEGVAFYVFGPEMRNAYVGLGYGDARPELSSAEITELQCVAQMGHIRFCELVSAEEAQRFDLAPREREILHWIARGKSNSAIATILGISPHTIDTLTRRLFDKLGATDRTTAAIRGVGAGLVLPG